jgi:hypothetical protein
MTISNGRQWNWYRFGRCPENQYWRGLWGRR